MIPSTEIRAADGPELRNQHEQRKLRRHDAERTQRIVIERGQDTRDLPGACHQTIARDLAAQRFIRGAVQFNGSLRLVLHMHYLGKPSFAVRCSARDGRI